MREKYKHLDETTRYIWSILIVIKHVAIMFSIVDNLSFVCIQFRIMRYKSKTFWQVKNVKVTLSSLKIIRNVCIYIEHIGQQHLR